MHAVHILSEYQTDVQQKGEAIHGLRMLMPCVEACSITITLVICSPIAVSIRNTNGLYRHRVDLQDFSTN